MDPGPGRLLLAKPIAAGVLSSRRASCSFLITACWSSYHVTPTPCSSPTTSTAMMGVKEFPPYGLDTLCLTDPVDPAPSTSSEGPRRVRPSCSSACLCNKSHVSKGHLKGERQHPGYTALHLPLLCPALAAINATLSSEVHKHMRGSTGFQGSLFQAILGALPTPHIPPHTQCSPSPLFSMCIAE